MSAAPQLPEGFIDRLKKFIPETDGSILYELLASDDPYSFDAALFLEAEVRLVSPTLDKNQKAELDELVAQWQADYTPPPEIATVPLYLSRAEADQEQSH